MATTKIEWADAVWNPITGCTPISEACDHCYAKRMAARLAGRYGYPEDDPFRVTVHWDRIEKPMHWIKSTRIFVCSMADLFHQDVNDLDIERVLAIASLCQQHTFMILTKRPSRALNFFQWTDGLENRSEQIARAAEHIGKITWDARGDQQHLYDRAITPGSRRVLPGWPLPNVWLGVTAENQARADERIPILLQIPAAVRFVSVEPMLGPVDLEQWITDPMIASSPDQRVPDRIDGVNWVICGGETGPGARPMAPEWVRSLRDQCATAAVPFFFKQWGSWWKGRLPQDGMNIIDGREWHELPKVKLWAAKTAKS